MLAGSVIYLIWVRRNSLSEKRVAILGRGKTLSKFKKFSHLFDTVYVVGTMHKEIQKIGLRHFEGKKIIHVAGRSDWEWRNGLDTKLNIIKTQTLYYSHQLKKKKKGKKSFIERFKHLNISFLPDCMIDRGYPMAPREKIDKYSKKYDDYKELCGFLDKKFKREIEEEIEMSSRSRYWPTSGIFAIDLALVENDLEEIYIFGVDCYLTGSYCEYNWEGTSRDHSIVKKIMLYHMGQIVKEFSSTKFYSSCEQINFNSANWGTV